MPFEMNKHIKAYFDNNNIKYYTRNGGTWLKVGKQMVRIDFAYGNIRVEFPMIYRQPLAFNNGNHFISWYEEEIKK
jgi:hypothetical protein